MSKEITKGKIIIEFENREKIVILKDFDKIKYSYSTKTDSSIAKLEFDWSNIEEPIQERMETINIADVLNNSSNLISRIGFNYIIKDNVTLEEEEKELFNTSYLNKKFSLWEIQIGSNSKSSENYDNNFVENNVVRLKFKVE